MPLDSMLHQFATNLEKKKADEEERYFDIATLIEYVKIDDLNDVQKKHLINNLSPTNNFKFPQQPFPDKSKKDGEGKRLALPKGTILLRIAKRKMIYFAYLAVFARLMQNIMSVQIT